jgi:ATP-dependent DNA helicase RecQ
MSFTDLSRILRGWPDVDIPQERFHELVADRLRIALLSVKSESDCVGPCDLASLIRYTLRKESCASGSNAILEVPCGNSPWPEEATWQRHGCEVLRTPRPGFALITAHEWVPNWLKRRSVWPPLRDVENEVDRRRDHERRVPADPAIVDSFKHEFYLSAAQGEAIRGVMLSPPGGVFLINLPTGGGKSLVGLSVALLGDTANRGVTVAIVPTVALAIDQVEQAKQLTRGHVDAWHSGLSNEDRQSIRQRMKAGTQGVLYVSPESLVGALAGVLYEVAGNGLLRAFIVDEAHMVAQWGHDFRPEFQAMGAMWRSLRDKCPSGQAFRTILMTATLTEDSYATLCIFFGPAERIEVISSVYLRPEPDYFIAKRSTFDEQDLRVVDVLRHGPRPVILYVTEVAEAVRWARTLRNLEWRRTGCVHGGSTTEERERAIDDWRSNRTDIMVATSAFGLGMDKRDVRMVIHACVPETIDRFYQEVGRGGRDGRASVSFLIYTERDRGVAARLGQPSIITEELGLDRWKAIWHNSKWDDLIMLANLRALRPTMDWDSSEKNMKWNLRTLLLLARSGALSIQHRPPPDIVKGDSETEDAFQARRDAEMQAHFSICPVRLLTTEDTLNSLFWETTVAECREKTLSLSRENWERMDALLKGDVEIEEVLRSTYNVPSAGIMVGYGATGFPPHSPRKLGSQVNPLLQRVMAGNLSGPMLVSYEESGSDSQRTRSVIDLIRVLIRFGIREIAVPQSWRSLGTWPYGGANPFVRIYTEAPERFIILRSNDEADDLHLGGPPVPRVTVLDSGLMKNPIPMHILMINRPLHIIVLPSGCPDHRHPDRRIGDVTPPSVMTIQNMKALLNL